MAAWLHGGFGTSALPRRRKSARERREQSDRAEGRRFLHLLRSLENIHRHRGSCLGTVGAAVLHALETAREQAGHQGGRRDDGKCKEASGEVGTRGGAGQANVEELPPVGAGSGIGSLGAGDVGDADFLVEADSVQAQFGSSPHRPWSPEAAVFCPAAEVAFGVENDAAVGEAGRGTGQQGALDAGEAVEVLNLAQAMEVDSGASSVAATTGGETLPSGAREVLRRLRAEQGGEQAARDVTAWVTARRSVAAWQAATRMTALQVDFANAFEETRVPAQAEALVVAILALMQREAGGQAAVEEFRAWVGGRQGG